MTKKSQKQNSKCPKQNLLHIEKIPIVKCTRLEIVKQKDDTSIYKRKAVGIFNNQFIYLIYYILHWCLCLSPLLKLTRELLGYRPFVLVSYFQLFFQQTRLYRSKLNESENNKLLSKKPINITRVNAGEEKLVVNVLKSKLNKIENNVKNIDIKLNVKKQEQGK